MLTEDVAERFWSRVVPTGFCWEWAGSLTPQGYGQFSPRKGMTHRAHRIAYMELVGDVPSSVPLDHLCRNRKCVNPDHLVPSSNRENVLSGFGVTARNARKTACDAGHEFTPENTTIDRYGYRRCLECRRGYYRDYDARHPERRKRKRKPRAGTGDVR